VYSCLNPVVIPLIAAIHCTNAAAAAAVESFTQFQSGGQHSHCKNRSVLVSSALEHMTKIRQLFLEFAAARPCRSWQLEHAYHHAMTGDEQSERADILLTHSRQARRLAPCAAVSTFITSRSCDVLTSLLYRRYTSNYAIAFQRCPLLV